MYHSKNGVQTIPKVTTVEKRICVGKSPKEASQYHVPYCKTVRPGLRIALSLVPEVHNICVAEPLPLVSTARTGHVRLGTPFIAKIATR